MHYFDAYDRHFGPIKAARAKANIDAGRASGEVGETARPLRMLEIGVNAGGSIAMWRSYFGDGFDEFEYHGIDINPECARFHRPRVNEHVHVGSQLNRTFLREVVAAFGPFDIVLDGTVREGATLSVNLSLKILSIFKKNYISAHSDFSPLPRRRWWSPR